MVNEALYQRKKLNYLQSAKHMEIKRQREFASEVK